MLGASKRIINFWNCSLKRLYFLSRWHQNLFICNFFFLFCTRSILYFYIFCWSIQNSWYFLVKKPKLIHIDELLDVNNRSFMIINGFKFRRYSMALANNRCRWDCIEPLCNSGFYINYDRQEIEFLNMPHSHLRHVKKNVIEIDDS